MKITCKVSGTLSLDPSEVPRKMMEEIKGNLTVPNPEKERAASNSRNGFSNLPAFAHLYQDWRGRILLPRGAVHMLKRSARKHGVEIHFDNTDVVTRSERKVPIEDLFFTLRPYQVEAVNALINGVQGYIKAPCGSGKTVIGASALVCTGETGLIIVHTHDLLDQWVGLLNQWEVNVRSVSGGKGNLSPLKVINGEPEVAVATVQTLIKLGGAAQPLLNSVGALILDEAHHAPANTFRAVIESCPARYRWGLTATPDREDGWSILLPLVMGLERWGISMSQLVDAGFLMRPVVVTLDSETHLREEQFVTNGRVNMSKAVNNLCLDHDRTEMLVRLGVMLAEHGRTTLILVPRVKQAQHIASRLQNEGVLAMSVTSGTSSALRKQRVKQMRLGRLECMVATQLADEGLDVPSLDAVIVASTGKAAGRAVQRIGRVMRTAPNKSKPIVIDISDPVPFRGQWQSRARAYLMELGVASPPAISRESGFDTIKSLL